jgi:CubicO group peptidase (beta-lactamase class C family)
VRDLVNDRHNRAKLNRGHPRMWHYGETVGSRTFIQRFPADDLTVVVLCNRVDFSAPVLALRIADLYLNTRSSLSNSRTSFSNQNSFPTKDP